MDEDLLCDESSDKKKKKKESHRRSNVTDLFNKFRLVGTFSCLNSPGWFSIADGDALEYLW